MSYPSPFGSILDPFYHEGEMKKNKNIINQNFLNKIEPEKAVEILKILSKENKVIAKRIRDLFIQKTQEVDVEFIVSDVLLNSDILEVLDVCDKSGFSCDGVDSVERSAGVVEEALEPHRNKMQSYHSIGMLYQEMIFCMGIILGLKRFENESEPEFKNWAATVFDGIANNILNDWKQNCGDQKLIKTVDDFAANLKEELLQSI